MDNLNEHTPAWSNRAVFGPRYEDLPIGMRGRLGWGVFGADDNVGMFNLQTPARILAAAALIRSGKLFSLNTAVDHLSPALFGRSDSQHTILDRARGLDDRLDNLYTQVSSQWDSLAHVFYTPGQFYNGATRDDIVAGHRNTVDHWARRGIAGRAVLLDVEAVFRSREYETGVPYEPGTSWAIEVADLEEARIRQGVELEPGDVLLVNSGWLRWYDTLDEPGRVATSDPALLHAVGLARGEEMAAYLWNAGLAAVASDAPGLEVWPAVEGEFGFLHHMLLGSFGMAIGELWWLGDLVDDCREDGRWEVFLTSAPLNLPGGIGSPANALAIK